MSWGIFGCSYTKFKWYTWADFLKVNVKKSKNYGLSGSSNEFICRQILKNGKEHNNVVVMWSGYDRIHNDYYLKHNGYNQGRYRNNAIPQEQLLERSLEYIWLANQYCKVNNIKIYNFSITILEIGETKQITPVPDYLDINHRNWPIDMTQYCLDNPSKFSEQNLDGHPLPSQHYNYFKNIVSPNIGVNVRKIYQEYLDNFDKKAVDLCV